jgi:hypothetical protein
VFYIKRAPIWPDPRVKPPFGAARVNWGHPLAQDLRICFLLHERAGMAYNLVGAPHASIITGGANPWTDQGFLGDGVAVVGSRVPAVPISAYALTLVCEVAPIFGAAGPTFVQLDSTTDATAYFSIWLRPVNAFRYSVRGTAILDGPTVTERARYRLAGVSRGAAEHEFWQDGVPVATSATSVTFPTLTGLSLGLSHAGNPSGVSPMNGRLNWVAGWRRGLTPIELTELAEVPFAYLEPVTARGARRIFPAEGNTFFVHSR